MNVPDLAHVLNEAAAGYSIGKLQEIRKRIHCMSRLPGRKIFDKGSIKKDWACHWGGRSEIQFNIGIDEGGMRHGVAFSLETSQSFPTLDFLIPKIARFNEFVRSGPSKLRGYEMWHWEKPAYRSDNGPVRPISEDIVQPGNFIFLGKTQSPDAINIQSILEDFDELLELYLFVEDPHSRMETSETELISDGSADWIFSSGHTPYARSQTATFVERTLDVELRHNWLQTRIHPILCVEYDEQSVGTELRSLSNGEIDFAIEAGGLRIFAELKTATRAITCIREALGQLIEYAYYGMKQPPSELWVIGTGACTPADLLYLEKIRTDFGIRLFYRRFDEDAEVLEEPI